MSEAAFTSYAEVMDKIFKHLQTEEQEILLLGAIPHVLDFKLAQILFSEAAETNLEFIRSFRFISESQREQVEYHDLARRFLLDVWKHRDPDRFRNVSNLLAQEYRSRLETSTIDSTIHASEWLFHNLAFDPSNGMRLVANLFDELNESRELGSAERLLSLIEEQRDWIGKQIAWLDYFEGLLAFSHYRNVNITTLEKHIIERPNTLLAACCFRLLGQVAVRQRRWADGRKFLLNALKICKDLGDTYYQALAYMNLGALFQNLVENSGGILVEAREFNNTFQVLLYVLARGPLLLYRLLSERINFLPNLYNMSYQNWVALHFLRIALRNYRSAEKEFRQLNNHRRQIEISNCIASLLLALGYYSSAERLCINKLQTKLVQTSPYYIAQFEFVLGQVAKKRGHLLEAKNQLSLSLETFERYGDWEAAGQVALNLAQVHEKDDNLESALEAYKRCLEAARNSQNILLQTEVIHRLDKLARQDMMPESVRQKVIDLHKAIEQLAYIDRYPGAVQKTFRNLRKFLILPWILLLLLFTVVIAIGALISVSLIAGEAFVPYLDPLVWWLQLLFLFAWLLLPLMLLWIYNLVYTLLSQIIISGLRFTKVDESQPNLFLLDGHSISQQGEQGDPKQTLTWENIKITVVDDRSLYRTPLTFSSRILLQGDGKTLLLPATTHHYLDLENEVLNRLAHKPVQIVRNNLVLLHLRSLIAALVLGLFLAAVIVISQDLHSCYGMVPPPGSECPPENRLYFLPIIPFGIFFISLFFGIISLARWVLANQTIKKASKS